MAKPINPRKYNTEETRNKISESLKKYYSEHPVKKIVSKNSIKALLDYIKNRNQWGVNNPSWKGGKTSKADLIRKSRWYKKIVKEVLERDDYTCQECGQRGGEKQVHHIIPFSEIIDDIKLLQDKSNLVTFCINCHKRTDNYGTKLATKGSTLE